MHAAMIESVHYLVIGGGITGLSFAHFCASDDYLVLEADCELGGYCKTIFQDGFVWDYSGHFFHFKDPDIEAWLSEKMPAPPHTIRRVAKIHHQGNLIDFPFQKNIHQLPREDFLDCLYELYFRHERYPRDRPARDFLELMRQNFGDGITERFLRPYNEKLYACTLDQLDVEAMGRFFPWAPLDDIIRNFKAPDDGGYNATFRYPQGGAIEYIHAAASGLDPARIARNEAVIAVDLERKRVRTTQREIAFDTLVSTAPMDRFLQLCGETPPEGLFSYNRVLVFNLGFDRKGPEGVHWTYFPDEAFRFYRVGFYDNIFHTERMSLYVEIGFPREGEIDVEAELSRVLHDLRAAEIVDTHELVSWHSVVLSPAYVHITQASQRYVTERRAALASQGVYSVGRYGGWTYCSIEDNILEARALAASLADDAS